MRVGGLSWLLVGALALAGCNSETGGSTSSSVESKSSPGAVRYSENPAAYVIGQAITANTLTAVGSVDRVAIRPDLPAGLSFDTTTGRITGTPTTASALTEYEVRAINAYGTSYTKLRIVVGNPAPVLTLSSTTLSGTVGSPISALVASNSGGAIVSCGTTPSLPAGLAIATSSTGCTISGTPTQPFSSATVTLSAASSARTATAAFTLSILDRVPQISFPASVAFPRGVSGYKVEPTNAGGRATSCSASPLLPSGIVLAPDCTLSGSPSDLSPSGTYALTATNSGGTDTAVVNLSVIDQTPEFYYSIPNGAVTLVKSTSISTMTPTITAGVVSSCSASPGLPAGLSISSGCVITGTPTAVQAETTHTISATNSAGSGTYPLKITVKDSPPRFSYALSLLTVSNRATANFPTFHNGGTSTTCSASPTIPAGLTLGTDCAITGSPTIASAGAEYTVTATNSGGSYSQLVQIVVTEVAPAISYAPADLKATLGTQISAISVQNAGGAITGCSVSPAFPGNLVLGADCSITGTPIGLSASTDYTITATNSVGSSSTTFSLEVVDRTPALQYPGPERALTINEPLSTWIPSSTGGAITSCSVDPELPTGLSLSTTDCSITGTPTELHAQQSYQVTAGNTGGTATTTITLTVKDLPPAIQFMPGSVTFTLNAAETSVISLNSGGPVTDCTVNPALPAGLAVAVSGTGCSVSGTATELSAKSGYTITGANSGGSSSTLLELAVIDLAPVISYATAGYSFVYTQDVAITSLEPARSGGTITSCTASPALPQGLSISTDCTISGTPTLTLAQTNHTITASNSGGSSSEVIALAVNEAEPTISYAGTPFTFTRGTAVADAAATATHTDVFSIGGTLPNGLTFNTLTGELTGTPTQLLVATPYLVTATNSTGQTASTTIQITVNDVAPSNLAYLESSPTYVTGQLITQNTPSSAGGAITAYSIDPALPAGLVFNTSTGVISGTPTATQNPQVEHTITGTNSGGSATTTITVTVHDPAPTISYSGTPFTFVKDSAIAGVIPSSTNVSSGSITGTLPAGLSLDASTGTISGTPTELSVATPYSITATNSTGQTVGTTIQITVNDVAPIISYATAGYAHEFTLGSALTDLDPTRTGGTITSCSSSPALPTGLSLDSDCTLSGTPAVLKTAANYTITALNSGGSSSEVISIAVKDAVPTISYSPDSHTLTRGTTLATAIAPTLGGGAVVSCSSTPQLPNGLSLSNGCVISGTPAGIQVATAYSISATNTGGTATTTLTLTIQDVAPSSLAYSETAPVYTRGTTIAANTPTSQGGAVISYGVDPALPAGLSLNASTGVISGTPTATQNPAAVHTITATNSGGSTTATITVTVNAPAPTIVYSGSPFTFTKNSAISDLTPTLTETSSVSVTPALPTGLSLDTTTGVISGTPSGISTSAPYTITATNSTGQTSPTTVQITVNDVAPVLSYGGTGSSFTYVVGTAIADLDPSNSGGAITACVASPALPAGLSIDQDCTISGTPSGTRATANYTVTASNTGGSSSQILALTVNEASPTLSYSGSPFTFTRGSAVSDVTAIATNASSFSIGGTLPNGLAFNTSTGEITGTPAQTSVATPYLVTATNTTGQTATTTIQITVNDIAPSSLSYLEGSPIYVTGSLITQNTPSSSGGPIASYAVDPALPAGLVFNTTTGVISGTATATQNPAVVHTITGTNSGGSTSTTITLTANAPQPLVAYAGSPFHWTKGTALSGVVPTASNAASFSISGTLPGGLSFDTSSGAITGTPTELMVSTPYSITATNSTGQTAGTTIQIAVRDMAPVISYATAGDSHTYTKGVAITDLDPDRSGGSITSCSSTPALPSGLSLDSDCTLSGTPSALKTAANYTITALNSGGSSSEIISLTIQDAPPTLSYASDSHTLSRATAMTAVTATLGGGAVTNCTSSPAMPDGLTLSAGCNVSGTPTTIQAAQVYSITAANSGGSASANLTITINDIAPSGLSYFQQNVSSTRDLAIPSNTPTNTGGAILAYSIDPALPAGIAMNPTTGVISGTPTSTQNPAVVHTITGTNTGGTATATITLTVNAPAPTIAYTGSPFSFTKSVAITALTPSLTETSSIAVSPALPAGLSLDTTTGEISGTPTGITSSAAHTLTATNSTGQTISTTIVITVNDVAPNISYAATGSSFTYVSGTAITDLDPANTGGAITGCTATPALPTGLSLDSDCTLSGTPTETRATTNYTITATNTGGSSSRVLSITVNEAAPTISYAGSPFTWTRGTALSGVTATATNASSFSISGTLPNGLSFNTSTGAITGTPSQTMVATPFQVTATNSTGQSSSILITITVNDIALRA